MKVVMLEPNKPAYVKEIGNDLASMQEEVEGYIEIIYPFEDENIGLVCNEEGKIEGFPLNRAIRANGKIIDVIAGNAFICDCSEDELQSLDSKLIDKYLEMFEEPERFAIFNGKIISI